MQKIRVTFFYADEAVWNRVKINNLLHWINFANRFFKKYNLELDFAPYPHNSKTYEKDFILSPNKIGIKPREGAAEKLGREIDELIRKVDEAIKKNNIPLANSLMEEARKKIEEGTTAGETLFFDFLDLRLQCNSDFIGIRPMVKSPQPAQTQIISVPRLAIIFCDISRENSNTGDMIVGATMFSSDRILTFLPFIFTFIVISLDASMTTLAHEISHALTGHTHPTFKGSPKDGPINSIFNYDNDKFKPEDLTLGSNVKFPGFSETEEQRLSKIAALSEFVT